MKTTLLILLVATGGRAQTTRIVTKPILYFPFESVTPSNTLDMSGNNVTGTINGNPGNTAGKFGNALNFITYTNYVSFPASAVNSCSNGFSVSVWVKMSSLPTNQLGMVVSVRQSSAAQIALYIAPTGETVFLVRNSANTSYSVNLDYTGTKTNQLYSLNRWHHIVGSASYRANFAYLMVDGNLLLYTNNVPSQFYTGNSGVIGRCSYDGTCPNENIRNFIGQIDDVRIYNVGITLQEGLSLYNSRRVIY